MRLVSLHKIGSEEVDIECCHQSPGVTPTVIVGVNEHPLMRALQVEIISAMNELKETCMALL